MVSIKCPGVISCLFVLINLLFLHVAQVEAGDRRKRERISANPDELYENPYPKTHPCYRFADISKNEFYSPAYPPDSDTYPSKTNCTVVITAPAGHLVELDFLDYFDIEEEKECKHDYLEIRDGPYGFSPIKDHRFCGRNFPNTITSSDRHLWVNFTSDDNIEGKGFRAVIRYPPRPKTLPTPEIRPCIMSVNEQEEGRLGSEDIDPEILSFNYKHNIPIDCMWVITVRPNWRIQLQSEKFNLAKPNDCESNFVQVFSNETTNQKQKFCGSIADTVFSDPTNNVLIVRFVTESRGKNSTFVANFTAYRDKDDKGCDKEEEFDCDDATCISKSLECNGRFNCRFRWDEDNCQSKGEWALSDDHIVIIMVIFSLILSGMFVTFLYNCVKKLIKDHRTVQEFKRSMEQLDKQEEVDKRPPSKGGSMQDTPSTDSRHHQRFDGANTIVNTPCYVPGGDVLPILIRKELRTNTPPNGDAFPDIYTVDAEDMPKMCDSACQTRESLFTTQEYSSGNSTPNHSLHTNSPPAPFSTFGYNKKDNKFKAEAKIEMHPEKRCSPQTKYPDKRRPYSVQTTKSAPDVIVTH